MDAARAAAAASRAPCAGLLTTINEAFDRVAMHARAPRACSRRRRARPACRCTSCRSRGRARTRLRAADGRRPWPGFVARRLHARGVRRSVPRGRAPLPRRAARRHRASTPLFPLWGPSRRGRWRDDDDRRRPARAPHLRRPARARSRRSPAARSTRAARRSAGRRRSVRRERRVPLVRVRRADVRRSRLPSTVGERRDRDGFVFADLLPSRPNAMSVAIDRVSPAASSA